MRRPPCEQARAVDAKRQRGEPLGPLAGVPVAVKDVLCTSGRADHLRQQDPAELRAALRRPRHRRGCKQADAVLIGKTNMDEFAMGSSTENSAYQVDAQPVGPGAHPRRLQRRLGGGGRGLRGAAGARHRHRRLDPPAGRLCGVVGLKPTYGRVSRYGLVAFASSLDQIGPFAHDVADAALLLEVIAGHDPRDSTSVDRPVPPYIADARRAGASR